MAVLNWSTLGGAYPFDPESDRLHFDDATISAAAVELWFSTGGGAAEGFEDPEFIYGGKHVLLFAQALAITTANVTFADGSRMVIGDDTTGTENDRAANTLNGGSGNDLLIGAGGADNMIGGDGDDVFQIQHDYRATAGSQGTVPLVYGNATLNGGNGIDRMFYRTKEHGVNVNFASGQATGGDDGGSVLTLHSIEWADGTYEDDNFTGGSANEFFRGFGV